MDGTTLPAALPAHVQPQYYGAIIAAEATGTTGTAKVVELVISNAQIAGYAFYEGTKLVRAVLINSSAFLKSSTTRASVHLDFGFTGTGAAAPTSFTAKRLAIGYVLLFCAWAEPIIRIPFRHADDASGLTWGGQSYETSDGRASGVLAVQKGNVSDGVDIAATEVVLVSFQ